MSDKNAICPRCLKPVHININRTLANCPECGGIISVSKAFNLYEEHFPTKGENEATVKENGETETVAFGSYKQSTENEPIEWIVLCVKNGQALLLSKYALLSRPFAEKATLGYENSTWLSSHLRVWLNDQFINDAFNEKQKQLIVETNIVTEPNPTYKTEGGAPIASKIFLLSIQEVKKYLKKSNDRKCYPTRYLKTVIPPQAGLGVSKNYCNWWLRTPGTNRNLTAYVTDSGTINNNGRFPYSQGYAVRPALWIKLD